MAYIPKNRIQSNLYTAGGEYYITGSNPDYVGYYHKLYTGKIFTGKTPSDKPNLELISIELYNLPEENNIRRVEIVNNYENLIYSELKEPNTSISVYPPQLEFPQPTKDNYKLGEFQRFFCKKRNEFSYLEISKDSYDKLVQQDPTIYFLNWEPFNIPWTLIGERKKVYIINRNIVLLTEKNKKFYGFSNYLQKEYLKYYKP